MAEADVVIRSARVSDGRGAPGEICDVAVTDDRISAVEARPEVGAAETVDAAGLALAPGFIDVHTHDDMSALTRAGAAPKVSQGVTTVVIGNCGISAAPRPLTRHPVPIPPLDLLGEAGAFSYAGFADYLAAIEAAGPAVAGLGRDGGRGYRPGAAALACAPPSARRPPHATKAAGGPA